MLCSEFHCNKGFDLIARKVLNLWRFKGRLSAGGRYRGTSLLVRYYKDRESERSNPQATPLSAELDPFSQVRDWLKSLALLAERP
jgi:hypothetical protein